MWPSESSHCVGALWRTTKKWVICCQHFTLLLPSVHLRSAISSPFTNSYLSSEADQRVWTERKWDKMRQENTWKRNSFLVRVTNGVSQRRKSRGNVTAHIRRRSHSCHHCRFLISRWIWIIHFFRCKQRRIALWLRTWASVIIISSLAIIFICVWCLFRRWVFEFAGDSAVHKNRCCRHWNVVKRRKCKRTRFD